MERKLHPRPQLIREEWELLDGEWDFKFDDADIGVRGEWYRKMDDVRGILVPFTYETLKSGINDKAEHRVVWYHREVMIEDLENRVLYFEGSDYYTQVWVNGKKAGEHLGGYERFEMDLGDYLQIGNNNLTVRVEDSFSCEQPRGKQKWLKENFTCWYTQTTGIWKSVWMEKAGRLRIGNIRLTPELGRDKLRVEPEVAGYGRDQEELSIIAELSFEGEAVDSVEIPVKGMGISFELDTRVGRDAFFGTRLWEPESPKLYDLRLMLKNSGDEILDQVYSYAGMRQIRTENGQVLLNGRQLYQRLVLDQGYWPESGLTPPSGEALEKDLTAIRKLGYNGLRKHQKTEDERFFYLCDVMGILTWVEMPSVYEYSVKSMENLTREWISIVRQYYNHPSVVTWVPFNESWGIREVGRDVGQQNFATGIYHLTKALDGMRPVVSNDGWEHTLSDIITLHDYEERGEALAMRYSDKADVVDNRVQFNQSRFCFAKGFEYSGQPVILSEFGGIAFGGGDGWGYGNPVKDGEAFLERFDGVHKAVQELDYVCGYCYTQLTDVEQEVNGLLTPDRQMKAEPQRIAAVNRRRGSR